MTKEELDELFREYQQIVSPLDGTGQSWTKYKGEAFSIILSAHLTRHLTNDHEFMERGWVEGFPTEFDLLLVKRGAKNIDLTPAYRKADVVALIEAKASGVYSKKIDADGELKKYADIANGINLPYFYITRRENEFFSEVTKRVLGEKAFILQIGTDKKGIICYDEWDRLIEHIDRLSGKQF